MSWNIKFSFCHGLSVGMKVAGKILNINFAKSVLVVVVGRYHDGRRQQLGVADTRQYCRRRWNQLHASNGRLSVTSSWCLLNGCGSHIVVVCFQFLQRIELMTTAGSAGAAAAATSVASTVKKRSQCGQRFTTPSSYRTKPCYSR